MQSAGVKSEVIGSGRYLPSRVVKNSELQDLLDTTDEWIKKRSGIEQRHWATAAESTSSLAFQASIDAFDDAGVTKDDIDMIIVATVTPDHEFPGTACFLQGMLDRPGIPAIDVRQQCSGFVFALSQADLYIRSGQYKTILLVCSELHSKCLDLTPRGRAVSILFGDGAGALILRAKSEENSPPNSSEIVRTSIHSDGSHSKMLWCPAPGTGLAGSHRIDSAMLSEGLQFPHMNGRAIFSQAVKYMSQILLDTLKQADLTLADMDLIFLHQANLRICEAVEKNIEIKPGKLYNTISHFGNTTAATIPLGLDHAAKSGALQKGMLIAVVCFGSGYTWGCSIIRW